MRNHLKLLIASAVFLFILLLTPNPVQARDCDKPTDFLFGNIVSPFIDPNSDCSMDYFNSPGNPIFKEWLQYAEITCIRDIPLSPQFIGDLQKALSDGKIYEHVDEGSGNSESGLQDIVPNIGIKAEQVKKMMDEGSNDLSPALTSITTAYEQFNIGQVEAGMRAGSDQTREEYMKSYLDAGCYFQTEDGQGFVNDFCESGSARWQSEEEQYYWMKHQKDIDIKCAQGNAEPQVHCQNSYNIGNTTTNVEINKAFFPKEVEDYITFDPNTKNKIRASTQRTKARTMICIALAPNIKKSYDFFGIFGLLWQYLLDQDTQDIDYFGSEHTNIACGDVQGLLGAIDGLEEEYRVYNPTTVGADKRPIANEIQVIRELSKTPGEDHADIPEPPKDSKYYARDMAIWQKLRTTWSACRGPQDNYKQFSGGNTKNTTMGDPNWLFKLINLFPQDIVEHQDEIAPYSLFVFAPREFTMLEHMTGRNAYSPYRAYLPLEVSQALDNKTSSVDIPWFLQENSGDTGGIKIGEYPGEPEWDEETQTWIQKQESLRLKYTGSGKVGIHQRGGQQAQNFKEMFFQMLKPLEDRERIDDTCLYSGLLAKLPQLPGILGLAGEAVDKIVGTSDDCRPTAEKLASESAGGGDGECKQWLFEQDKSGTYYYDKIIAAANSTSCGNGTHINPYYAIAIALNEDGALTSSNIEGRGDKHFGCDIGGAIFGNTIEEKMTCMLNTLQGDCAAGEEAALNEYGYSGSARDPLLALLDILGNSSGLYASGTDTEALLFNLTYHINPSSGWSWKDYFAGALPQLCEETKGLGGGPSPSPSSTTTTEEGEANISTSICTGSSSSECLSCLNGGGVYTAFGCLSGNGGQMTEKILQFGAGIAGGLAFLMTVYGTFLYIMSAGDPKALQNAKSVLVAAISGLLFIIFSVVILNTIGFSILGLPGF